MNNTPAGPVRPAGVQHVGFILIPGFSLMSFAAAVEPLRAANLLAGRELYRVSVHASAPTAVAASLGFTVPAVSLPRQKGALSTVFVCAGGTPGNWDDGSVRACLRRLAREGVAIGGISGGPYLMAAAGLLDGRDFTIHWEHLSALREAFPALAPRQSRFVIDGNRITCGGGVAPLDMMYAMISSQWGAAFARRVSDWFLHTGIAEPADPQRGSLAERYGVHHPAVLVMLDAMEASIERPLSRSVVARRAGLSERHLDRLFTAHVGTTFLAHYRQLRLEHARRLLQQSPLSISEIAFATGFSSAGHFSRAYRTRFGHPPRAVRARRGLENARSERYINDR